MKSKGWGWRYLKQTKVVGNTIYRLHATRGWKPWGKVAA